MTTPLRGLHHVTAIASDPQANLDFYAGVLGLRLVKKTVNFDDPTTYHFYFGNGAGDPGTLLTFFPWPGARPGSPGSGVTSATSFAVPDGSLPFWSERLSGLGTETEHRFQGSEERLRLRDPDGLVLELVARKGDAAGALERWSGGPVPGEVAIRSLDGVTLSAARPELTALFLTEVMGFEDRGESDGVQRFDAGDGPAPRIDIVAETGGRASLGAGSVHHIAFRIDDDPSELEWRDRLLGYGLHVSPVMDRNYFHSIYFREPGGVLFEIATDPPGFAIDEPVESLGGSLRLPPQYEPRRSAIEAALPELREPNIRDSTGVSA